MGALYGDGEMFSYFTYGGGICMGVDVFRDEPYHFLLALGRFSHRSFAPGSFTLP